MSFKENACRKFQANIFNKSKCQNCFKPRESHLLNDEDLNQAKPIYGGWLLLAPEGTNFENPLHRCRKWQRRFFILYEHGLLRYALDEMPSTLPQGTINMNQCSDVIDGESRTGQKNSLCILTPDKEHFIRAECKEIINGWQEALTVYPRTNKQNHKKKRKVDPPTQQEPGPAKVTVTSSGGGGGVPCRSNSIATAERVPMSRASLWQEEARWSRTTIPCSRSASCLSQLSQSQPESTVTTQDDSGSVRTGRKVRVESGYFSLEKTKSEPSTQPVHPPQYLPLSSSASSSSSLGAATYRYNPEPEPPTSPLHPSPDPLPSAGGLASPSYSTVSSSQSSLESEPSSTAPTWERCGSSEGSAGGVGGAGGQTSRRGREYAVLSDVPRARRLTYREAFRSDKKRQELRVRTRSPGREEVARLFGEERRRSQIIGRFEEGQHEELMDTTSFSEPSSNTALIQREGRSERRYLANKHELSLDAGKERSLTDASSSTFANLRRAKSLDRRVTESSMTPDLLNFKKGWMTKLYDDGMWKKHWFVLTDQSLRYYKDSIAEEASDMDGEIDLSTCYDVKEFPVQRNYGFQILCKEGACTLSAMTSGIRRNWIQAIMKNVRPTITPDVTRSLPEETVKAQVMLEPCPPPTCELVPSPEGPKTEVHTQLASSQAFVPPCEPRKSRVRERRREGRSKTLDWAEFKMEHNEKPAKERADTVDFSSSLSRTSSCCSPSSSPSSLASSPGSTSSLQTSSASGAQPASGTTAGEAEKEDVRRSVSADHTPNTVTVITSSRPNAASEVQSPAPEDHDQGRMEVEHLGAMLTASDGRDCQSSDVQEEIEQRWHQVETTPLREEKQVPIATTVGNSNNSDRLPAHELAALLDKELGQKQKELDQLQKQNNLLKEQLEDALGREQSAREGYVLQSTCERGFAAMEETHQKVVEDLQRQHQREISKLMEERERLLAEETAATIAAIEAMKNAHKEELEKTQRSQLSGLNSDIDELRLQYEEELRSIHRELEVLSEQYSQKCLENAHLAQALEAERQALRQCQRENQELNAHNQELNNRLTTEITRMRSCFSGETSLSPTQGKDVYELEVLLRIKESEIQYLKQEIHSLKDELQSALRDKKYATDKYKDIYTELSIVKAKADCDISKLKEKLLLATEVLGERTVDGKITSGYAAAVGGGVPCRSNSIATAERVPMSRASLWQEEARWSRTTIPCSRSASCLSQLSQSQPESTVTTQDDSGSVRTGTQVRVESGYFSLEKTNGLASPSYSPPSAPPRSSLESEPSSTAPTWERCGSSEGSAGGVGGAGGQTSRRGREYAVLSDVPRELSLDAGTERSLTDASSSTFANLRRAKSLDRRVTEVLNDLEEHWFVLTDQSLRYYKDSIAEEASDMDGEIDLSTCYDVKEFPVQRNYGFQILCKEGACTLSAMTSGIRRNWIQAIMKNVRPTITPDVTRKNISLKLSVLKPRSLPEETVKAQVMLEPCPPPTCELVPSPEGPKTEVHTQLASSQAFVPPCEPRKSRVRERRREGRSKTLDWAEFKMEHNEKPAKERADTVDFSSSLSRTSSCCSPSSSPSSLASSPGSTSSLQTSSASGAQPASGTTAGEAEKEDVRRSVSADHTPNTVTVITSSRPNAASEVQSPAPEDHDQGRMEVEHLGAMLTASDGRKDCQSSDVQEEIEQRWHQVETTPLREEKQVPIATTVGNSNNSDRLPAHELAALLDKELGQKQKQLDQLQKQNNLLKEQLEDALGREQSAREGYVLQSTTPSSTSLHRVSWQHLHKLNQDLQGELETQKRKQDLAQQQIRTLKRSYTEAQDAVDRHEVDIQALQAKLASAMAEILAGEQAVARMRNELRLEQERSKEQQEEFGHSETTLRAQLKESEDRLREVEASLLERNQVLRHLERQQALQRDHMKEVKRLQERLQEVTARLNATEEGQTLKEERLKEEQRSLQERHERERQNLCRKLAEAVSAQKEMEDRLLEAEQQVEALLRGRQASGGKEHREEVMKLQEELAQKTNMVETLRDSVRRLEEEKSHLTCRCQELLNQIAEADHEVNKLRSHLETEEAKYNTLEHSYERASEEFQKMSQFLREKEDEICQTKEMYERLVERKEEDLKESLVKMAALGNSLEETEQKLQVKEERLCQMSQSLLDKAEPCRAEKDLQAKLVVAEDRIAELELHLHALQLGYADLHTERQRTLEQNMKRRTETSASSSPNTELSLSIRNTSMTQNSPDDKECQSKRPRIQFSSIQCQKFLSLEGVDSVDSGQKEGGNEDVHPAEGSISSDITLPHKTDPEKFISIIHALETKLLVTEEKLRNLTQNIEEQQSFQDVPKIGLTMTDRSCAEKELSCGIGFQMIAANKHYANALLCLESSQEKVKAILSGSHDTADSQLDSLSEIENELFNASLYLRQGQKTLDEHSLVVHQDKPQETPDEEALHLFARTLSFEAAVLNKMAVLIQNSKSDLLQVLGDIWDDIENIKRSDKDCLAVIYADVLTRKLMLESALCKELEKAEKPSKDSNLAEPREGSVCADATVTCNAFFKAELAYSVQNLKVCYEEKFRALKKELIEARYNLHQREIALKAIFDASKRSDLKSVVKEVKNNLSINQQKLADIRPPELAPYMEQIEREEARNMAEELIDRQLIGDLPSCDVDPVESLENAHDNLVSELKNQAAVLHKYVQEIESGGNDPRLAKMIHGLVGNQIPHNFTSASLYMREALIQAQVAYVACRLRALHKQELLGYKQAQENMEALVQQHASSVSVIQQKYEKSLQEQRLNFAQTVADLQMENQTLKSEINKRMNQLAQHHEQLVLLEEHFQKETKELKQRHEQELNKVEQGRASTELALMETTADSQRKLEVLLVDMDTMEEQHENHLREMQEKFEQKICELQHIHKNEIKQLHAQYGDQKRVHEHQEENESLEVPNLLQSEEVTSPMEEEEQGKGEGAQTISEVDSMVILKDRIQELESQMNTMKDKLENKHLEGDVASLREKYQRDFESLKSTCERGFAAMEETHQKVVEDLQRQHQREISKLMEERERLLAEETAATIAAIEAMKNAHKEELEKTQRSQLSGLNSDIDELRLQYEEELRSIHRELEVLSEQYSQKCLENAHLAQALEAERQALRQCQRENQELNAHNQELNNRLTTEITRMRSCFSGETSLSPTQGKDVYELEVLLRIKESEIQYLKQEIHSLKDELQSALRDKKYATDKYKDIYTELSIVKAKADCDISKLKEKLLMATEVLGERTVDGKITSGYDIMKSKSNPDFMKKEQSTTTEPIRGVRSKSLKEGLTVQERMKLFEAKDSKMI
ncbi:LOW QUALITY PROTEIN: uncharacterized protein LOC117530605 [Thalassophryne amazonica]|uniref:LOW QUALITY PROTEIN: uncharacterized protein LOC117530605 n=1 Tax=Thalassophryne amazonica TaxID=390379 RepID=UPI001471026C|nr:LOW QUALITY PROTEIN: uncharacterized protein LOC117530605 [Thalassophryne amazonica]